MLLGIATGTSASISFFWAARCLDNREIYADVLVDMYAAWHSHRYISIAFSIVLGSLPPRKVEKYMLMPCFWEASCPETCIAIYFCTFMGGLLPKQDENSMPMHLFWAACCPDTCIGIDVSTLLGNWSLVLLLENKMGVVSANNTICYFVLLHKVLHLQCFL